MKESYLMKDMKHVLTGILVTPRSDGLEPRSFPATYGWIRDLYDTISRTPVNFIQVPNLMNLLMI